MVKYPETSMSGCTFPNFTYMDIGYIGYSKDILAIYLDILNLVKNLYILGDKVYTRTLSIIYFYLKNLNKNKIFKII